MDNGRIMKELKELQEAAKNVYIMNACHISSILVHWSSSAGKVSWRQPETLERNYLWTCKLRK